tara:strand:+ start:11 stop:979 length:969 start_codon:yes stop_codon:yes gene_type:complete
MLKIKGQRGIFVFSDPAGAKACLALVKSLKNKEILIISDRKYSFYSEFNLEVNSSAHKSIKEWFDIFKPDFVFTGTSLPNKIELEFLKEAKNKKIKTYSFVDHWTNMSDRFKYFEEYIYPDELWLIDDYAKEKAISDGIDEDIIVVSGNPYYDYLKEWKPNMSKDDLYDKIGLRKNEKYILYAPEPISTFNLQEKYGFDELSGLIHLNKSLEELKSENIKIIIKPHPNQNETIFINYIKKLKFNKVLYIKDININPLIYYSELVSGYFSNSLVESNIMNKKVIRILIDLLDRKLDSLMHLNIGSIAYDTKELNHEIKKAISN